MDIINVFFNSELFNQWVMNRIIGDVGFIILGIVIIIFSIALGIKWYREDKRDGGFIAFLFSIPFLIGAGITATCGIDLIQIINCCQENND